MQFYNLLWFGLLKRNQDQVSQYNLPPTSQVNNTAATPAHHWNLYSVYNTLAVLRRIQTGWIHYKAK